EDTFQTTPKISSHPPRKTLGAGARRFCHSPEQFQRAGTDLGGDVITVGVIPGSRVFVYQGAWEAVSESFLFSSKRGRKGPSESSQRVRPLWRESDGNYDFRTTFSKVRRTFTISRPLWQKLSRNWKSRTEFGKVGRNCEKTDGNCKFPGGNSQFPDRILYFRPDFAKVVRNLKKSADFRKSRATLAKVRRKS